MKSYVIAAIVIILVIGGIVWYKNKATTTVDVIDASDVTATTTDVTATTTAE